MIKKLLVTGFEPFGGSALNPSGLLLQRLCSPPGWELRTALLPVCSAGLPTALENALNSSPPGLVLSLGEARGSERFRIERVAKNRLDFSIPDNSGRRIESSPILSGGACQLLATLPAEPAREALIGLKEAVALSDDAGGFLCNQAFYWLLHRFQGSSTRVGFLHLPSLPEQDFGEGVSLARQSEAVQAVITALCADRCSRSSTIL